MLAKLVKPAGAAICFMSVGINARWACGSLTVVVDCARVVVDEVVIVWV